LQDLAEKKSWLRSLTQSGISKTLKFHYATFDFQGSFCGIVAEIDLGERRYPLHDRISAVPLKGARPASPGLLPPSVLLV